MPVGRTDGDPVVYFTGSNAVHMGDPLSWIPLCSIQAA